MSKKLLIVISSVRERRIADTILDQVKNELKAFPDIKVDVADFKANPLPFFDSAEIPSAENFVPVHKNVAAWTKQVEEADTVLFLVAEYNHSYTSVIKNAIDWIYLQWQDKPIAFIGYGWVGGVRAIKHLHGVFEFLKPRIISPEANLRFTKEINLDGTAIGSEAADEIKKVLATLYLGQPA